MEFLFPLKTMMRAGMFLLLVSVTAPAKDYCSLTVEVANGRGYKPTGVSVTLVEGNGRVESGTTKDGEVRFCDLGMSSVTLTVGGSDRCNEVVVRNIALNWGLERIVDVVYDREYCNVDELQTAGCWVLLRFVDEQGKSISGVQFDPPIGKTRSVQSDGYGRAMVGVPTGEALVVNARSPSHNPERIELKCSAYSSTREMVVTLHGAGR
jgi:hypothetical protein